MGKIMKKKKGRPSKVDLARKTGVLHSRNPVSESDHKRKTRRRNLTYSYDFDDDDEEDEERRRRRRREKKLKLVLRLPVGRSKKDEGFNEVDSVTSQTQLEEEEEDERRRKRRRGEQISETTTQYGNGNMIEHKARKIDGEDDFNEYSDDYEDDDDNDDDGGDDDEKGFNRSMSQKKKKESGQNVESKGMEFNSGNPLPDRQRLELILDKLQRKDTYGVFAYPVDPEELPDYHDVIEHPMDFGTIRKKLASGTYCNLEELESDILLICSNAMQYNAAETIYYKQANSIQDLARKRFQRIRIDIERTKLELKAEQKTKSNNVVEKPVKKPVCPPLQEPVGSDFSSGATLATVVDACPLSNPGVQAGGVDKPSNVDGLVNENSSLTENKPDEAEEQLSGKGFPSKLEKKHFEIDENRRATYSIYDEPVVRTESIFTTFEDETKQLVSVGLHADHSYARSMACFAATLGPFAWKVASRKIEQALPVGMKFGRGWVGEYEPLPTPVVMLGKPSQKQQATNSRKTTDMRNKNSLVGAASSKPLDPANKPPLGRKVSERKPPLFGVDRMKPSFLANNQQQSQITVNSPKPENILKQIELKSSSSAIGKPVNVSPRNQFEHDSETKNSTKLEMVSRSVNLVQCIPFKKPDIDGKVMISADSDRTNCSSDFVSDLQARAGYYSPRGNHHQGLNTPNQMMRMLAEKTQHEQKSSNPPTIDNHQLMISIPSPRRDDSSAAATAAARAWMSLGAPHIKPMERSEPPKMEIKAASLYNPPRESSQSGLQCRGEPPSGGLQFQSLNRIRPQALTRETLFQNNRQMGFPQRVTADLSQFQVQSPWQGFIQNTQTNKKRDMLPPDLNITFQSSGSSGIMADSQQPDLALQL